MVVGSSSSWDKMGKVTKYKPEKEIVESLRKRVPAFRPFPPRLPATNDIQSCCFSPPAMLDYLQEYQTFLMNSKWKFMLASSTRLDMENAWIRKTKLEFWAVEGNDNIGRAFVFRFEDCGLGHMQRVQIGNPAEISGLGLRFRDGDLCYCFEECSDCLMVNELFYLETITGKGGFVKYGVHQWVPCDLHDWKLTISNLVGVFYSHEQPGMKKVYG